MTKFFLALGLSALCLAWSPAASAQEITIEVANDDTVSVRQGVEYEQVVGNGDGAYDSSDASRMTVLFPEQKPAVYELESEEDYLLVVDAYLPDGADILLQATEKSTGQPIDAFEHTLHGGDWLIDANYMDNLPSGEVTIYATLRTPGRPDAKASHPFYILEPNEIGADENSEWFDWELDDEENSAPFVPGEGFMVFDPPADARVYYVSATGSDNNSGLSQSSPLRTLRRAYEKVRDDSGDWILLKAGDTFEAGFGVWAKSGKSPQEPLHVGVYGDGDRPLVRTNGGSFWRGYGTLENLRFDGIHAFASQRLGVDADAIAWNESGFAMFGKGRNVVLHDMKIEGFKFNVIFQGYSEGSLRNILLYRCIINNAYGHWDGAIAGHSSGIFAYAVDGMEIVECTLDRNGWHPQVSGATRTKFNHNIYIQFNCHNVNVRRSIVTRGGSHGLQLRCGGDVVDNFFSRNALGFYVTRNPSIVENNVVTESTDISDREIRGLGFAVYPVEEALVTGNIVTRKIGRAGWMHGIEIGYSAASKEIDSYDVTMHNNVVWDWYMKNGSAIGINKSADLEQYNNTDDGVDIQTGQRTVYADPNVSIDRYFDGGLAEFIRAAVQRRRGEWDDNASAPAFNAYMREGFSPAGSAGSI
ncbi:MAG: right-handed parallel beta-helix repeat-containing protein [Planctomycetota bacterium]